jgi:hypothetical protein
MRIGKLKLEDTIFGDSTVYSLQHKVHVLTLLQDFMSSIPYIKNDIYKFNLGAYHIRNLPEIRNGEIVTTFTSDLMMTGDIALMYDSSKSIWLDILYNLSSLTEHKYFGQKIPTRKWMFV